jgi:hypothetical protein
MPCADVATATAKAPTAINLIISFLHVLVSLDARPAAGGAQSIAQIRNRELIGGSPRAGGRGRV